MMLCCLRWFQWHSSFLSRSQVFLESISTGLTIGLEAFGRFSGLQQAGGGSDASVSPAFDLLRVTWRTVPNGSRRCWCRQRAPEFCGAGRMTVRISSSPTGSARTPGSSCFGRARLRSSPACRVVLVPGLTERLLDASWEGQALDDVRPCGPGSAGWRLLRIALQGAFAPSTMKAGAASASPLARIDCRAWTTTVFVAPSTTARMLVAVAIDAEMVPRPVVADGRPSIWMTSGRAPRGPRRAQSLHLLARHGATKRRETADFEVPSPRASRQVVSRADATARSVLAGRHVQAIG